MKADSILTASFLYCARKRGLPYQAAYDAIKEKKTVEYRNQLASYSLKTEIVTDHEVEVTC